MVVGAKFLVIHRRTGIFVLKSLAISCVGIVDVCRSCARCWDAFWNFSHASRSVWYWVASASSSCCFSARRSLTVPLIFGISARILVSRVF